MYLFQAKNQSNDEIRSHRVIKVDHFFKELINISGHDTLFNCGLHSMSLKEEIQKGLISTFKVHCNMCNKDFKIANSDDDLNTNLVAGVMAAGCGHTQLKQFSAALDLPILSAHKYKIAQDQVCDEWEVTAWEEMKKAGEREKEAALKAGNVDKNGIPIIDVVVDGSWCKRSYRTNYSALSGTAAIIGRRFGQVLFLAVKNKYCCVCARAEHRNEVVKQHECFKNYAGSSTSMESTIICEGFKKSIEMHGVIYGRFIADGDSSTYAKILEARPYTSLTVEKIGCRNHILRNFCTKLQLLKTNTQYAKQERNILTNSFILSGRKYICDAIKNHNCSEDRKSEGIKKLHKDICNAMCHAYGYHDECNKLICSANTESADIKKKFNTHLFTRIRYITGNVASQARSLIENVDSNVVERFNGVIAKFIGGKRINYALKRSYQARCAGAIVSFNSGKILTTVQKNIYNQSPSLQVKKFEEGVEKQREYNRKIQRKRNRKHIQKKIDFNYGENVLKPDLDSESFELAKAAFLKTLEKTDEERRAIEQRTILQSESGEWLELRRNLLTASNFGKVIKRKPTNTCANIVKNMLYKPTLDHVASISHGKKNEKIAFEQLSNQMKIDIRQCGLFLDENYPFLGATPDGVADDMLIEVKCPIAPFKIGIDDAIQEGKMHFWKKDKKSGDIYVNKNSDWFLQAQGQMHICKYSKCLLAVWYGENKLKMEILQKDDQFWNDKMEPKLLSFYYDCLLPELVDPRHTRNMAIRDPVYVIRKTTEDKENRNNNSKETNGQKNISIGGGNEEYDANDEITIEFDNF